MKKAIRNLILAACGALLGAAITGCGQGEAPTQTASGAAAPAAADPIAAQKGKVLLLLAGMPGCAATAKATEFLTQYAPAKPDGVAILRLDVPPPGGKIGDAGDWTAPFPREIDATRKLAARLDFFYYPTFYILDAESTVRFAGGCEPEQVKKMVGEILAEKPGAPKRMYTPPLPKVGETAAEFVAENPDGKHLASKDLLGKKATLLYFGSTTCPFSVKGLDGLAKLVAEFKEKEVAAAIINQGTIDETEYTLYRAKVAGVHVLVDADCSIGKGKFGVQAVPFFYVLDAAGKIVARRPFTESDARAALNSALGLAKPDAKGDCEGAG